MDTITAMITANVERMLAQNACLEACGGFECFGWCKPPVLFPSKSAHGDVHDVEPEAEAPSVSTRTPELVCTEADTAAIPIVIYKPQQLFVGGDPGKGFVKPTIGTPGVTTWNALARMLSRASEGDPKKYIDPNLQKAARGGWSACALHGGRRLGSAFIETRLLGLDIDKNGDIEKVLTAIAGGPQIASAPLEPVGLLPNQGVVNALAEVVHAGRVKVAVRSVYLQGALTDEGRALPQMPVVQDGVEKARDRKEQIDAALTLASGAPLTGDERAALARLDLRGDPACDPRNWPR